MPDDVMRARRHVADGERLVAEQRDRIADLAREGHNTESAIHLLATLEQTLQIMREHLEIEERLASRT